MAVKTRIESVQRDVQLLVDELLSPAARSRMFAEGAAQFLAEADETNRQAIGRIPRHKTFVDGRQGAPLASVRPNGVIVRDYDLVFDVLLFINEHLRTISPVGKGPDKRPGHPGFYRKSHVLFADGKEVMVNGPLTAGQIPDAAEWVFLSDAPYARRLEMRSAIYEMTAAKAHSQFKALARVSYGWRAPYATQTARQERAARVPAIIVTLGR